MKVTNSRGRERLRGEERPDRDGDEACVELAKVPINGRSIINSDQVLDLPNLPKTMIIVGGGVIGVEYYVHVCGAGRARDAD